jgi:hypothetical protein
MSYFMNLNEYFEIMTNNLLLFGIWHPYRIADYAKSPFPQCQLSIVKLSIFKRMTELN